MANRRHFIAGVATGLVAGSTNILTAQQPTASTEAPPQLDTKLVRQFVAKSHGDFETVKELLQQEPRLVYATWDWGNGDCETALNASSHVGRREIAEYLLENGARLDAPACVMLGMKGVVKEMLRAMPNLHAVPGAHGIPLLSHAIFGGQKSDAVFEMLLESGADVNASSNMKMTPLMAAASTGRISQVKMLLEKGADPTATNTRDETALDIAKRKEKHKCAKALQAAVEAS